MKTIFEKSGKGKRCATIELKKVKNYTLDSKYLRNELDMPELAEIDIARHYTELSGRSFGVDNGFYPLGSCTMKYNPKINEEAAALSGFTKVHPLQPVSTVQGCLKVMHMLGSYLSKITGMDGFSLQPNAGAHGEFAGLLVIDAYHKARKDFGRNKIIIPDSAHGTNPASAAMAGFEVISVPSDEEKGVDIEALKKVVGDDTAAIMLTNPTTLGLFEKNVEKIAEIVHGVGGLLYYDGANLNAIMGVVRPGDMGFDVVHLNLHKTFSTPHGGGGPGSGPIGCKKELYRFLPNPFVIYMAEGDYALAGSSESIGRISGGYGNFLVYLKALCYILTLGREGIRSAAQGAVLAANYIKAGLEDIYPTEKNRFCMHEFVISAEKLKEETGVSAMDIAKAMIDKGIHPPTVYFPLIVHEALMIEPTETENKETLDDFITVLRELHSLAYTKPEKIKDAPHKTVISRPDEVRAARQPIVRWKQ